MKYRIVVSVLLLAVLIAVVLLRGDGMEESLIPAPAAAPAPNFNL